MVDATVAKGRRRRRWPWVLLLLLALAAAAVALAGPPAAAALAERAIVARLEEDYRVRASLEDVDLGWGGDAELRGLALVDLEGRPVAALERVRAHVALGALVRGTLAVDAAVEGLELHLREAEDGGWNVEELPRGEPSPPREEEPGEAPDVRLALALRDARVLVHHADGRTTEARARGDVHVPEGLARPGALELAVELAGPDGPRGTLDAAAELVLAPEGVLDPAGARGELRLAVAGVRLADLAPLLAGLPLRELGGTLDGQLDARLERRLAPEANGELVVTNLSLRGPREGAPPLEVERAVLRLATAPAAEDALAQELELDLGELASARWSGRASGDGPATTLTGSFTATADLARAGEAARGFVALRDDVAFEGTLRLGAEVAAELDAVGPRTAAVDVEGELAGLAARDAEGPIDLAGLADASFSAALRADAEAQRLEAARLALDAGPARAEGSLALTGFAPGDAAAEPTLALASADLALDLDLDALGGVLARLSDGGGPGLGGTLAARLAAAGDGDQLPLELALETRGLRLPLAEGGAPADLGDWTLTVRGRATPARESLVLDEIAARGAGVELDGEARVTGAAGAAPAVEARFDARVAPDELGPWARELLAGAGLGGSPATARVELASEGGLARATARVAAERVALALPPADEAGPPRELVQEEVEIELAATVDREAQAVELERLAYAARGARASVTGTLAHAFEPEALEADLALELSAELARVAEDLRALLALEGYELGGALEIGSRVRGSAGALDVEAEATIAELRVRAPRPAPEPPLEFEDPRVQIDLAARVDGAAGALALERLAVDSTFLRGTASGRLARREAPAALVVEGLRADLRYVPDRLGALLAPLLPGRLSGADEEPLVARLDGEFPLASETDGAPPLDLGTLLAHGTGSLTVGVGRYEAPGLALAGEAQATLADGKLAWQGDFGANDGALALEGVVELGAAPAPGEPPPARVQVRAADVRAETGLAPLLAWVHPAFAAVQQVEQGEIGGLLDARVDLAYDGPITPELLSRGLAALPLENLDGGIQFALRDAVVRGSPFLAAALDQLGIDAENVSLEPVRLVVRDGRITYPEPWSWTFGNVATSFAGSIGLDRTLELVWNVPVTAELAEKNDFLRPIAGEVVSIPIRGTVSRPRVELEGVLQSLLRTAAERGLRDVIGGEIGEVLGGGKGGAKGGAEAESPAALLARADRLWGEGKRAEAAALYREIREKHRISLVYLLNEKRIDERAKER